MNLSPVCPWGGVPGGEGSDAPLAPGWFAPALVTGPGEARCPLIPWGLLPEGLNPPLHPSQGGMKAVVWTDVFQMFVMLSGFVAIAIQGTLMVGSPGGVLGAAYNHSRVNFAEYVGFPAQSSRSGKTPRASVSVSVSKLGIRTCSGL